MRTNINITIDKLNIICFQQMRVVGQFRTVSYLVTVDNFMSMAERLNDLVSNFLQVMCAIGDKNGELQQAKPDVALTDLETVRVVHQLPRKQFQVFKQSFTFQKLFWCMYY